MVEVRFRSRAEWRLCCDSAKAASALGGPLARRLALRLQQLAAMDSLEDIVFLPCQVDRQGTHWVVTVDDDTSIVVSPAETAPTAGLPYSEILVVEGITQDGRGR